MGYTHNFDHIEGGTYTPNDIIRATKIAKEVAKERVFGQFISRLPKDKDDWSGLRSSKVQGKEFVTINGYNDFSCECLHLCSDGAEMSTFVKTNRKPYDVAVVAIMALWERAGLIRNTCGGTENYSENISEALQYSVEDCLSGWEDNDDALAQGYVFHKTSQYINAFNRIAIRLGLENSAPPALDLSTTPSVSDFNKGIPRLQQAWF